MQIRERGRRLLLLRTHYDKERQRTFGRTFATLDASLREPPADVLELLSEDEIEQLRAWFAERDAARTRAAAKMALATVAAGNRRAAQALADEGARGSFSEPDAEEVYSSVDELTKALRRAGFKRQKRGGGAA